MYLAKNARMRIRIRRRSHPNRLLGRKPAPNTFAPSGRGVVVFSVALQTCAETFALTD